MQIEVDSCTHARRTFHYSACKYAHTYIVVVAAVADVAHTKAAAQWHTDIPCASDKFCACTTLAKR